MQTTREKDFVNQMTTQERETELQLLRDRLALHESKMYGNYAIAFFSLLTVWLDVSKYIGHLHYFILSVVLN